MTQQENEDRGQKERPCWVDHRSNQAELLIHQAKDYHNDSLKPSGSSRQQASKWEKDRSSMQTMGIYQRLVPSSSRPD